MNEAATIRQQQLAQELRELRADMTAEQVRAATGISSSKLSRIESAHVRVQDDDLRKLAPVYGLGARQIEALLERARAARDSFIAHAFTGLNWPKALRGHLELEASATSIDFVTLDLVPGLLQTPAYTRALISERPDVDQSTVDSRLEFRAKRQERVRLGDLELWAILDEAALHRLVGGPEVLAEQLHALVEAPQNVAIQILPWRVGAHASCGTPFHLFRFPAPWRPLVYQETLLQGIYRGDDEFVSAYARILDAVRATALSPRESRVLLEERIAQLRE